MRGACERRARMWCPVRLEHHQLYPSTLPARDCILGAATAIVAGPSVCRGAPRCVLSARFRFSVPA